jgi:hypothetical protein
VSGPTLHEPQFPSDDGSADPRLREALAGYAAGRVGAHHVLNRLNEARLLVPVVAAPEEALEAPEEALEEGETGEAGASCGGRSGEMAMPTLIGEDGRRGALGFTSAETMKAWRPDARPIPVHARQACLTALDEGADALVVDVAGPVPFAVEGLRLHLLAEGRPIPPPHEDPEVLAAVEAAFGSEEGVAGVRVTEGTAAELSIRFRVQPGHDERAAVQRVSDRLAELLRGKIVGGVELTVARP